MLYGGYADLNKDQNGVDNYTFGVGGIQETNKNLSGVYSGIARGNCGVKDHR